MKKIVTYLIQTVSVLVMMLAFACGTIAFAELGYSAVLVFTFGYAFALLSMYLILILHELIALPFITKGDIVKLVLC